MGWFCKHNYKPKKLVSGQSMLGEYIGNEPEWGIRAYCLNCGKSKIIKGFDSRMAAEEHLGWLQNKTNDGGRNGASE